MKKAIKTTLGCIGAMTIIMCGLGSCGSGSAEESSTAVEETSSASEYSVPEETSVTYSEAEVDDTEDYEYTTTHQYLYIREDSLYKMDVYDYGDGSIDVDAYGIFDPELPELRDVLYLVDGTDGYYEGMFSSLEYDPISEMYILSVIDGPDADSVESDWEGAYFFKKEQSQNYGTPLWNKIHDSINFNQTITIKEYFIVSEIEQVHQYKYITVTDQYGATYQLKFDTRNFEGFDETGDYYIEGTIISQENDDIFEIVFDWVEYYVHGTDEI